MLVTLGAFVLCLIVFCVGFHFGQRCERLEESLRKQVRGATRKQRAEWPSSWGEG